MRRYTAIALATISTICTCIYATPAGIAAAIDIALLENAKNFAMPRVI